MKLFHYKANGQHHCLWAVDVLVLAPFKGPACFNTNAAVRGPDSPQGKGTVWGPRLHWPRSPSVKYPNILGSVLRQSHWLMLWEGTLMFGVCVLQGPILLWYLCLQTVSGDQDSNHTWGKMLTWHLHFPQMDPAYRRGTSFRREKTRVGHAWVPWLSGNKPSTLHPFSCNCLIDFVRHKLTPISPFCVWGNWGSESTTNLHKVI